MVARALMAALLLSACGGEERTLDTAGSAGPAEPSALRGAGWAVGDVAPDFVLRDQHDQPVSLHEHQGQLVLLEVFAAWCVSCQHAAPQLEALWQQHAADGLVVLSLMVEGDGGPVALGDVAGWAENYGLARPILDADEAPLRFDVESYPTYIVVDRQSVIQHLDLWPLDERYLEALLAP